MDCTNWDDMEITMALGVIRGYSDGLVRPGNVMTKAETAAVLSRIDAIQVLQKGFLVSACEGTVSTEQGGILNAGEVVYPGTKIITGEGAGLTLYADDSTTIRIASNTTLEIEEYVSHPGSDEKHTSLVVWCGKIIGRVQKMLDSDSTFEIHTPTAIAGIRGTAFAVEVEESGESRVSVYTGQVRVAGKNKAASEVVEVKANEETRITALNQVPSTPEKVNLEIKDNWVKDQIKEALKEESAALVKVPQKAIKIKKPKNAKQENNSKKPGKDTDDKNKGNNKDNKDSINSINNGNNGNNGNSGNNGNNGNKNDNGNNKKYKKRINNGAKQL